MARTGPKSADFVGYTAAAAAAQQGPETALSAARKAAGGGPMTALSVEAVLWASDLQQTHEFEIESLCILAVCSRENMCILAMCSRV